jgi:hypothetical protein
MRVIGGQFLKISKEVIWKVFSWMEVEVTFA